VNQNLLDYLRDKYAQDNPSLFDVGVSQSTAAAPAVTPPPTLSESPNLTLDSLDKNITPGFKLPESTPEMFAGDPLSRNFTADAQPPSSPPAPELPNLPAEAPHTPVGPSTPPASSNEPPAPIAALASPATPALPAPTPAVDPVAGFSPADRARLAADQGTSGRELAGEALAGLGDAVAKGAGGTGGHLKNTIQTVNDKHNAALDSFDKQRAMAVQNYDIARKVIENNRGDATAADMQNPTSPISRAQQALLDKVEPGKDHSKISALQAEILVKPMLERYKIDEMAAARKDARSLQVGLREDQQQDRLEQQARQSITSLRGDKSLSRAEEQRDAAIVAYNRLQEVEKSGKGLNPIDYTDILGQLYKARTGQAPGEQTLKEIRQATAKGKLGEAYTLVTGEQAPATTDSIAQSLKEMAASMGKQADDFHENYMKPHLIKPSGLSDDRWAPIAAAGRGKSFREATGYQERQNNGGKTDVEAAKDWLAQNPTDPRADGVKKRLAKLGAL
jgi:hypothetical protein